MSKIEIINEGILESGYGLSPKIIMRDKELSIEAKAIYAYISSFAGQKGSSFPSVELMMKELGVSEKRLRKHRDMLIDKGYIEIRKQKGEKGKFDRNLYVIKQVITIYPSGQNTGTAKLQPYGQNAGTVNCLDGELPGRQNDSTNINSLLNINSNINNNSDINNNTQSEIERQFEDFYKLYPRKIAKNVALRSFKTQIKRHPWETILMGTKRYNDYVVAMNTSIEYIKHPSTFLNQEGFLEAYEIPQRGGNYNAQRTNSDELRQQNQTGTELPF